MLISLFKKNKFENRPKIRPEMMPVDWLMEISAIAGIALLFGYAVYWYRYLPQIIPTHFGGNGKVDGYGDKSTLYMLPSVGLFVYVLMTMIALVPHTFNFPGKITPQNAMRQYRLATRLIRYLKMAIMYLFFSIEINIVKSAMNAKIGTVIVLLPVMFAAIFIPIIIYMILATKKQSG